MFLHRYSLTRPLIAAALVAASSLSAFAQKPPVPTRVRGAIESVDGDVLTVKSRSTRAKLFYGGLRFAQSAGCFRRRQDTVKLVHPHCPPSTLKLCVTFCFAV